MDALVAIVLIFLPVIIYFVRSPFRHSHGDILVALLAIWIGFTVLIYLENWLFSGQGGYWAVSVGWVAMCAYAWCNANGERSQYDRRNSSNSNKPRTRQ